MLVTNILMNAIDRAFIRWIESDDSEIITSLLKHGANVRIIDNLALKIHVERGNLEIVTKLLEHGADVNSRNGNALILSAKKGFYKIVNVLLTYGADVHACDDKAIMLSVVHGRPEITAKLLENRADGDEALKWCVSNYYFSIKFDNAMRMNTRKRSLLNIALLLENGANIYSNSNEILKKIREDFDEEIADLILQYCGSDTYHYFPDAFIKERIIPTKSANRM